MRSRTRREGADKNPGRGKAGWDDELIESRKYLLERTSLGQ